MLGVDASGSAALGVSAPTSTPVAIYSTERTPCMHTTRAHVRLVNAQGMTTLTHYPTGFF